MFIIKSLQNLILDKELKPLKLLQGRRSQKVGICRLVFPKICQTFKACVVLYCFKNLLK